MAKSYAEMVTMARERRAELTKEIAALDAAFPELRGGRR